MDAPLEPRWLDAEEQQTWLALASVLMRLPSALDTQLQRDAAISHFEYQVLAGLSMSPERTLRSLTTDELAADSQWQDTLHHADRDAEFETWIAAQVAT